MFVGCCRATSGLTNRERCVLFFVLLGVVVRPPGNKKPGVAARGAWAHVASISEAFAAKTPPTKFRAAARRAPFVVVQGGRRLRRLGATPSSSLRLHRRRTPPPLLTPRRPFPPWGRQAPEGARPRVPRGTLGGRPARRRVVEGARYGGPGPEGLHPATPCRRRPQGRDGCPQIAGARGARLCDKHDRTPKRPTLLLP